MSLCDTLAAANSALKNGRATDARRLFRQVLKAAPQEAQALYGHAAACFEVGAVGEGLASITTLTAAQPSHPVYQYMHGLLLAANGRRADAAAAYQAAIAANPNFLQAHFNLALLLRDEGEAEGAISHFSQAERLAPQSPAIPCALGDTFRMADRLPEALDCYQRALSLNPNLASGHMGLGAALAACGQHDKAEEPLRRAVYLEPQNPEALRLLGVTLGLLCKYCEAAQTYQRLVAVAPRDPQAFLLLGAALVDAGEHTKAKDAYRQAIALDPKNAEAHTFLSYRLLAEGNYRDGLRQMEWRLKTRRNKIANLPAPRFRPDMPQGTRVLIQAEQGYGDMIQCARYARVLADRGFLPILQVPPPLIRLLSRMDEVYVPDHSLDALAIDAVVPIMSLPLALGEDGRSPPYADGYIPQHFDDAMAERITLTPHGLNIGIVWRGDPQHPQDRQRSMPCEALTALARVPGLRLHSLQMPSPTDDMTFLAQHLDMVDHSALIGDFSDTADLIALMDLVITVDTSVAHLAGALGKPVWIMLAHMAEWRWRLSGDSAPRYHSAKLWRQPVPGDWTSLMEQVADSLCAL